MRAVGVSILLSLAILAPATLVGAAEQETAPWKIDDPAGDQYIGAGPGALPGNPATNHGDLRGVTIDSEDESAITFTFRVESLKVDPRPDTGGGYSAQCVGSFSSGGSGARAQYQLTFDLAGSNFRYLLLVRVNGEMTGAAGGGVFVGHSALGLLCLYTTGAGGGRLWQPVPTSLENGLIHAHVGKAALLGQLPPPDFPSSSREPQRPAGLKPGDKLTNFVATSAVASLDALFCCLFGEQVRDVAPNSGAGPDYPLRERTANGIVRLRSATGSDAVALAPGNQSAGFTVTNAADAKRLLRMDYHVEGQDASRVRVSGPAVVTVAGRQAQNFSVAIDVSGSSPLEGPLFLRTRGESTGYPDEVALARVGLSFGAVLSPVSNVLYVHAMKSTGTLLTPAAINDVACVQVFISQCKSAFLSTDDADPAMAPPNEVVVPTFVATAGLRGYLGPFVMRLPSAAPIALGAGQTITLELKLSSPQPVDGTVQAILGYASTPARYNPQVPLGDGSAAFSSSSAGTVTRIALTVPSSEALVVPSSQYLRLYLDFTIAAGPGAAVAAAGGLKLIGKDTKVVLPLVEVPDAAPAVEGTFQLRVAEGGQEFVNPGKARLLNVTMLNQASENRTAKLTLEGADPAWGTQVLPGDSFVLQPGDAIRIGVRVTAPTSAAEGQRAVFYLNASDEQGKPSSLRLAVIATSGVQLPDDAGPYEPDVDTKDRLAVATTKDTPGVSVLSVVLAIFVTAFAATRLGRSKE